MKQYKNDIKKLILILQGKRNAVLNSLRKEMKQLSEKSKFEEAAKIRDRIYNLQQVMSHANVISSSQLATDFWQDCGVSDTPQSLSRVLKIDKDIHRIECYDVSNIQGKFATGSMVVFENGMPNKNLYRKFKIRIKNEPNDIAMLKETVSRRLKHTEWPYPDLMLIDGGKAQLNAAISSVKNKKIKVISIAKGKQELFIEGKKSPIPLKNLPQEVYTLIKQLDDEAHRFAIAYHKKLRKKSLLQ